MRRIEAGSAFMIQTLKINKEYQIVERENG
jgi:hypothetical protein